MTPELWWTTWTALLAAALWIPFVVGVNVSPTDDDPSDFTRPRDPARNPPWVHRAHRAHLNLLEQFLPMAVMVLIAHVTGVSSIVTVWATGLFLLVRVGHAAGMISGWIGFPWRPILFTAGFACVLAVSVEIMIARFRNRW